jgi:hypothetical protein
VGIRACSGKTRCSGILVVVKHCGSGGMLSCIGYRCLVVVVVVVLL